MLCVGYRAVLHVITQMHMLDDYIRTVLSALLQSWDWIAQDVALLKGIVDQEDAEPIDVLAYAAYSTSARSVRQRLCVALCLQAAAWYSGTTSHCSSKPPVDPSLMSC